MAREARTNLLGQPVADPIFTKKQEHLRWSRFRDYESQKLYIKFRDEVTARCGELRMPEADI